jgi:tetratricopeptide (TPR) repeat protein
MLRLVRSCFTVLLALTAFSTAVFAQTHGWPLDGHAFSASPAEIQAAAALIKPEPFTNVTVLFEQEHYRIDSSGKATRVHQLLYRIETKAGVEGWSQTSVQWDPWYQNQPSIRARILQANGKVSELDPHTLTDVPAKNEQDDAFSNARIYKGPLPSLAIGAIVEEETAVVDKLPFFSGGSVYRVYLSRDVPVIRSRVVIETPEDTAFQSKVHFLPDVRVQTQLTDGIRRSTYDQDPVPLAPSSDIDLATDKPLYPYIEFSTGVSWAAVASAYQKIAEPQIQPDRVKALLSASTNSNRLATVQALVSRLHYEIRYTGIEFGESGLQPQTPAEILKRHYGDCKDKAAVLVAMLRASGIPANLALLQAGPGSDVNPDLPGMNQFNHAIVHVPAGNKNESELWIDATAEFTRVGDLPYGDQGRLALIIADGTKSLTLTPEARPADSVLVETRQITLAQMGPAHIVESSTTTGHIDADYRSRYGVGESKAVTEDLEQYSKQAYAAKALTHIEHGDGSDFSKPFVLRLDMANAARGSSGIKDAAVAIPPAGILNRLPRWFSTDPDADSAKLTPEQETERKKKVQARSSEYLIHPFVTEWRYRILLPEGFAARTLPEDQTLKMGPATLTRRLALEPSQQSPAVITAVYRFDSGKQRYSLDEVLALRKAVLEEDRKNYLLIYADQAGAKLLTEGKFRQALTTDRALIAAHPSDAMHHVHMSSALLSVGLGEQAQKEARLATTLNPHSSTAFSQLATALEYNNIGVFVGNGFDRKAAIEAYRKAKQLDTEDIDIRAGLAVLYEYDPQGDRYSENASLSDAVREYRELKDVDKSAATRYEDNLLYAMLYNHQFADVLAELATQPSNATRDAMTIAATAASQTVASALQAADRIGSSEQKNAALRLAGQLLIRLNLYSQAAELLTAGIQGQENAADLSRQIDIYRNLHHSMPAAFPPTDPKAPVQLMMTSVMTGTIVQTVPTFLTRHSFATETEWKHNLEHNGSSKVLATIAKKSQIPLSVMRDLIAGNLKFTSEGDDSHGYHVTMQSIGAEPQQFFVSREEGQYKIVASGTDTAEVGNYAVYLLRNNRQAEAVSLLDWKRSLVHRGGGDDPLAGDLFARFWTEGSSGSLQSVTQAIQISAIALTIQKPASQLSLEPAIALYQKTPPSTRSDLALLLACAWLNHNDGAAAKPYIAELLHQYPNSITAISLAGRSYAQLKDFASWSALLDARLAKRPSDRELLNQSAFEAESQGDFARARKALRLVLDSGKATSNDYNGFAWLALFDDHLDAESIQAGQQANLLSKNSNFGDLHTLACLYAAQGKTTEARQLLFDAMAAGNQTEPNSSVWFGFGSIYEQFGETEAAIAAYRKVTPPEEPINPIDTYNLAQTHLKDLRAN